MQIVKAQYAEKPEKIKYMPQADGSADAWLRNNIERHVDEAADGEVTYTADEVFFNTRLSIAEIEAQFDEYFVEDPVTTVEDLVEALDFLTEIVLEG